MNHSDKPAAALLIVDDQEHIRDVMYAALRGRGVACWVASSGEAAIRILIAHADEIGAALVDLYMPAMDGLATVAALRAIKPNLQCLLATGGGAVDEAQFLASGAHSVIAKPFMADDLYDLLSRISDVR